MTGHRTGAQALVAGLEAAGVRLAFGIPGGAVLPLYDALYDAKQLRHVLVRHEQGAGHAAVGYALATGKTGCCIVTSGPGATNLVTPIANANADSVPIVAITGQVASSALGKDSFQEADICGITLPITKHNVQVTKADDIPGAIAEAFHIAATGRPGPVLVDVTKDALQATTTLGSAPQICLPGYRRTTVPNAKQLHKAARLLLAAKRPVLYSGGGVARASAGAELRALAELTGVPVVTTLTACGTIPGSHPLNLGMPGRCGTRAATTALQLADVIIAIGTRFDECVTGPPATFAPHASIVHADIDPAEISRRCRVDVPIVGDAHAVLTGLLQTLRRELTSYQPANLDRWRSVLDQYHHQEIYANGLSAQHVLDRIAAIAGRSTIYVAGAGQPQIWAAHRLPHEHLQAWVTSGPGTPGFAIPAALGAQLGRPKATVWAVECPASFTMTYQELVTCTLQHAPIKLALLTPQTQSRMPDPVKIANATGCIGLQCTDTADLDLTIEKAMGITDSPVVVEFLIPDDATIWHKDSSDAGTPHRSTNCG